MQGHAPKQLLASLDEEYCMRLHFFISTDRIMCLSYSTTCTDLQIHRNSLLSWRAFYSVLFEMSNTTPLKIIDWRMLLRGEDDLLCLELWRSWALVWHLKWKHWYPGRAGGVPSVKSGGSLEFPKIFPTRYSQPNLTTVKTLTKTAITRNSTLWQKQNLTNIAKAIFITFKSFTKGAISATPLFVYIWGYN